jgi:hypothetical protein
METLARYKLIECPVPGKQVIFKRKESRDVVLDHVKTLGAGGMNTVSIMKESNDPNNTLVLRRMFNLHEEECSRIVEMLEKFKQFSHPNIATVDGCFVYEDNSENYTLFTTMVRILCIN